MSNNNRKSIIVKFLLKELNVKWKRNIACWTRRRRLWKLFWSSVLSFSNKNIMLISDSWRFIKNRFIVKTTRVHRTEIFRVLTLIFSNRYNAIIKCFIVFIATMQYVTIFDSKILNSTWRNELLNIPQWINAENMPCQRY